MEHTSKENRWIEYLLIGGVAYFLGYKKVFGKYIKKIENVLKVDEKDEEDK